MGFDNVWKSRAWLENLQLSLSNHTVLRVAGKFLVRADMQLFNKKTGELAEIGEVQADVVGTAHPLKVSDLVFSTTWNKQ